MEIAKETPMHGETPDPNESADTPRDLASDEAEQAEEEANAFHAPVLYQGNRPAALVAHKIKSLGAVSPKAQVLLARMFETKEASDAASPAKALHAQNNYLQARNALACP